MHDSALLRAVFDSIDEGFAICEMIVDDRGVGVDYRFVDVNPHFTEMTGLLDPVGRTALELVPDLEAEWIETYARVALGGEFRRFEQGSDVMGRWFEVFAMPLGARRFAIVFKDQTARRQAESVLRSSELRFRSMADQLPVLLWQHTHEGEQLWVNHTFCTFFGLPPDRLVAPASGEDGAGNRSVLASLHPDDVGPFLAHLRRAGSMADDESAAVEHRCRDRDGVWRWLQSTAIVLHRDSNGVADQLLSLSIDVSERKATEAALQATAAIDAYRARLADGLRQASNPSEAHTVAAQGLGRQLDALAVHFCDLSPADGTRAVEAISHTTGAETTAWPADAYGDAVVTALHGANTIVVTDTASDSRLDEATRERLVAAGVHAWTLTPRLEHGVVTGFLAVHLGAPHPWSTAEIGLVIDTAQRTWDASERTRAVAQLRQRHDRAHLVANLLSALEDEPDAAARLEAIVSALVPTVADHATIEVPGEEPYLLVARHVDPDKLDVLRQLRIHHRLGPDNANSAARSAMLNEAILTRDTSPQVRATFPLSPDTRALLDKLGPRSHMAVPLVIDHRRRAVLTLGIDRPERPLFEVADLEFVRETAQRIGVVLTNIDRRHAEHDIAVRLQRALLPDTVRRDDNVDIEARYVAAGELMEVGGDWYDTFRWPDGHLGLIVGDVAGHNLDSAAAMGRLRAATSALATRLPPDPAALLDALDDWAHGPDGTHFTTAVCVVVDPRTGVATYSSAGHPPAIVAHPDGSLALLDAIRTPPLGVARTGPRRNAELVLRPGSLVVAYTDGLIERRDEPLDDGIGRLRGVVSEVRRRPLTHVADHLTERLLADRRVEDDVVVACLRYSPQLDRFEARLPGRPSELPGLRRLVRAWLDARGAPPDLVGDVLLGIAEACTNAIEHGYRHSTGESELEVRLGDHGHHLIARISDQGRWSPQVHDATRGRGTSIMNRVAHRYERATAADGTTITLTYLLP